MGTHKPPRTLIIAAHPDDEVLGCGGTAARLAAAGGEVFIAILGEGLTSRSDRRDQTGRRELLALREASQQAGARLGARAVFNHDLPDNRFDTVPLLDVVKLIEGLIERVQPSCLYTHHGGDLNIDHAVVHRAVLTATRPGTTPVRELYAFEVPSSTEWAFGQWGGGFQPNVFQDITSTLEIKVAAMELYESERRPDPHPRSPEALRAIAKRWGSLAACPAAEAFTLIRSLRT